MIKNIFKNFLYKASGEPIVKIEKNDSEDSGIDDPINIEDDNNRPKSDDSSSNQLNVLGVIELISEDEDDCSKIVEIQDDETPDVTSSARQLSNLESHDSKNQNNTILLDNEKTILEDHSSLIEGILNSNKSVNQSLVQQNAVDSVSADNPRDMCDKYEADCRKKITNINEDETNKSLMLVENNKASIIQHQRSNTTVTTTEKNQFYIVSNPHIKPSQSGSPVPTNRCSQNTDIVKRVTPKKKTLLKIVIENLNSNSQNIPPKLLLYNPHNRIYIPINGIVSSTPVAREKKSEGTSLKINRSNVLEFNKRNSTSVTRESVSKKTNINIDDKVTEGLSKIVQVENSKESSAEISHAVTNISTSDKTAALNTTVNRSKKEGNTTIGSISSNSSQITVSEPGNSRTQTISFNKKNNEDDRSTISTPILNFQKAIPVSEKSNTILMSSIGVQTDRDQNSVSKNLKRKVTDDNSQDATASCSHNQGAPPAKKQKIQSSEVSDVIIHLDGKSANRIEISNEILENGQEQQIVSQFFEKISSVVIVQPPSTTQSIIKIRNKSLRSTDENSAINNENLRTDGNNNISNNNETLLNNNSRQENSKNQETASSNEPVNSNENNNGKTTNNDSNSNESSMNENLNNSQTLNKSVINEKLNDKSHPTKENLNNTNLNASVKIQKNDLIASTSTSSAEAVNQNVKSENNFGSSFSPSGFIQYGTRLLNKTDKICFTGEMDEKRQTAIEKLGGQITNDPTDATVLVADKFRRTFKFICAICRSIPIVSNQWIKESIIKNNFVNPYKYILKDEEAEKNCGFHLEESLMKAKKKQLFRDYTVLITNGVNRPSVNELRTIVKLAGGRPLVRAPKYWGPKFMMGSAIEKLASSFRGVVNKDINNDKTGVDKKNQGSLQPGIIERHKKIHKEKKQADNGEETFKRVEIKETLIKKQSKLFIKKGPDDKIVVARQTHTTEQSTKFAKNYLNGDPLENVEVSSTTQDDQSLLVNLANNLNKVSVNSNGNLSLKNNIKTYKNAQKIIGLNDSSESDSTILLMPCNLNKRKKIKNSLSKNKNRQLKNEPKLNLLENKESEMIKSVDPLSDSNFDQKNNPPLSKENLLNKKMSCEIQDKDVADSDSTLPLTSIDSQNIRRIDSVNDSDSTLFLTPVEQNTGVVHNTPEIDSDSTIILTSTEQPKNRKKKMNEISYESYEEPPKKKSKNFKTCEKVSNQSIYKVPHTFSPKELKEKFIKIVKEEKLKKKIVAIFKHEEPAQTDTLSISSSQELKDKLDKILEDEESVNNNKSPKIDELRPKLTEMFADDVLKSQIEPPSTSSISNEEVLNILKSNQHVNSTVDTSVNERVNLSLSKKENSLVKKPKTAEKKRNSEINKEKSSRSSEEINPKKSKVVEENEKIDYEELEDTLKLDESNDSQSRVLEETLKLPEIPEPASYELVEVGDLNHQSYNEESDWTDSSFGKLVIDESADETPELLDTSNLNEITEDFIDNEKDPLYVDNSDYPLAICVFEDENQSDEQQLVDSLKENNEADPRVRLTETQVDNSDISLKNFDKNRELLVVVDRVDVDKFKRKNSVKVTSSLKARSNLKEKISLSNSRTDPFDLCLKKELRVILERLPLKINQNILKNKNKINITEPKNKIIRKSNNSRKRTNNIIKHKTGRENQKLLREVRIVLTPVQWKNDQNLNNKQTNNSTINDEKRTRRTRESQNKDKALILVLQSTRKRLDNSNSAREIKKTLRAKSSSKVVKNALNSNNLAKNRKLKSKLKAIKIKCNSSNLILCQTLKELKVTLERISTADLAKWRNKNSTRSKVSQRSKVSSQ
ncbi:uncharacterized protein LOC141524006 [Cotesia typhae]|uniref:uncharacterized protein LOC141524006 n=1 Tax=Cotesia typhae TaxID=2053667 RepID=UPI003D695835